MGSRGVLTRLDAGRGGEQSEYLVGSLKYPTRDQWLISHRIGLDFDIVQSWVVKSGWMMEHRHRGQVQHSHK